MRTSFVDLVRVSGVPRIEIPIIQRDYAQGRPDVARVRDAFLDVLHGAVAGGAPVHLDFVYGEIVEDPRTGKKLVPLDGQQRLAALFLLHWYLAARAGVPTGDGADRLPALTYETRSSSRLFCRKLASERPAAFPEGPLLSRWLRNRPWFVRAWRHDPTIESMVVVLDEIHTRFRDADCGAAWQRLVDRERPAVTFDFLSIENLGLSDDLYIKMNSRGKPLTDFENFKAELESLVKGASQSRYDELCAKIDNQWTDIFWRMRGNDDRVDPSFAKYFAFVNDTLAMRAGVQLPISRIDADVRRAELLFGKASSSAEANLADLFAAFDAWHDVDVRAWFEGVFAIGEHQPGRVTIPSELEAEDLLSACCKFYRDARHGPNPSFPLYKHLFLFAVIRHLSGKTADFADRIRMLRNLALNSQNELRQDTLAALIEETSRLVSDGRAERGFNARQIQEETQKAALVAARPALKAALERLEDHPLLRGCLAAFDPSAEGFERRAAAFAEIFAGANGTPIAGTKAAMLACGDYAQRNRSGKLQFGSESVQVWRDLFAGADLARSKAVLEKLLDEVGTPDAGSIQQRLRAVAKRYLATQEASARFDWRYYLVKYAVMRSGKSGIYAGSSGTMSFSLCMLDKKAMHSDYYDPFLLAACKESGVAAWENEVVTAKFTGYATAERWIELSKSGAAMRCVEEGYRLRAPANGRYHASFAELLAKHRAEADGLVRVPQVTLALGVFDTADRVTLGAALFSGLVAMLAV